MSSLTKRGSTARGVVSGIASFLLPGSGQVINGKSDKGIGMAVIWGGGSALAWLGLPILGPIGWAIAGGTAIYSAADAYLAGKGKK